MECRSFSLKIYCTFSCDLLLPSPSTKSSFISPSIRYLLELSKAPADGCSRQVLCTQLFPPLSRWILGYICTIKTLNDICQKLNLELSVSLEKPCAKSSYTVLQWDSEKVVKKRSTNEWITHLSGKEAIA